MATYTLTVNGNKHRVNVEDDMPLLWVLRDEIGLTGTKFGCGRGLCGTCTIHLDGEPTRSCMTSVEYADGSEITTIEGLSKDVSHPLQQAWIDEEVPQCGYCQSGQIMTAAALLEQNSDPSDDDIDVAMKMNLCRCGTYQRIRKAIHRAAKEI
ncbi:MAG TPA: (2Fe-2S)-binding protein [Candidatus Marinimicrobia bacterium]|jgi:aerobic-type carbon monoxide dehydrogenase small subunit (CoxS/CutS family)|nr:(2Fe-2S)-binding protein [Candidatus Neomarinimicrobiota bacterium]HIM11022.1 (2Fe-2S)-binding protein [Candidatus Poribacteria bacterium]HHZ99463.1 (2Fe-2S)-binding protein [Candidatus Neomarinimicrobiota bacterium]HIB70434.1 (2Fe-2S)-binding protein [Candidatus Neomarinimicrobiota bacterium]HIB96546.1 (2Fe-2S)-binding protein [Candidatus Neomarinimicrobiota bacterium]